MNGMNVKKVLSPSLSLTVVFILLFTLACTKAPITGRNQLILVTQEQELQMGEHDLR